MHAIITHARARHKLVIFSRARLVLKIAFCNLILYPDFTLSDAAVGDLGTRLSIAYYSVAKDIACALILDVTYELLLTLTISKSRYGKGDQNAKKPDRFETHCLAKSYPLQY